VNRKRIAVAIGVAALVGGGFVGVAAATAGRARQETIVPNVADGATYNFYKSMMRRFGTESMMGTTSNGPMMGGVSGYRWLMGGTTAPSWMQGAALPGYMTDGSANSGKVMGALFADAPGPRVTATEAVRLGNGSPAGGTLSAAGRRVSFPGSHVRLVVLLSPAGGPDQTFRIAGMVDPTITITRGAQVSIEVVNADPDMAHGFEISGDGSPGTMPMMTVAPAFRNAALWFLGNPTKAGMHTGTLNFTATTPGRYEYLCPVPGHAQDGMVGTFVVTN
jgi:rusticyanin